MNAKQNLEILRQLNADRKAGETIDQYWSRKAKEQTRKQKTVLSRRDPSEIEYREQSHKILSAASFVAPDEFPLELVASVAAKFCEGKNYKEAVERAICLLQECKDTITENKA